MSKFNPSKALLSQITDTQVSVHAIVTAENDVFLAHCECITMVTALLIDKADNAKERKYILASVLEPLNDSQIKWLRTICVKLSKGMKADLSLVADNDKRGKFAKSWAKVKASERKVEGALVDALRAYVIKNKLGDKRVAEKFDTAKRKPTTKDEATKTDPEPNKILPKQAQAIDKFGKSENVLGFVMDKDTLHFVNSLIAQVNAIYPDLLDDAQGRDWLAHAAMRFVEDHDRRLEDSQTRQLNLVKADSDKIKSQAKAQQMLDEHAN